MERSQVLDAMSQLKLYGMKAAYDGVIATAVKRQHEPQKIVGDLLMAEISEKQARSIKYQMTIARLPLAKEIDEFAFETTPVNETLVRDLAGGEFLEHQRNVVLIGGTGTGKSHLAVGIARACIRSGRRGRFFNAVDLVNKLDAEARADRQGRTADLLCRLDFLVLDELGYLPFAQVQQGALVTISRIGAKRADRTAIVKRMERGSSCRVISLSAPRPRATSRRPTDPVGRGVAPRSGWTSETAPGPCVEASRCGISDEADWAPQVPQA
jgi:DNA replication protein DnaC